MSLAAVVDDVVTRVAAAVGPAAAVSDRHPADAADLPQVTVSVDGADRPHVGVGGRPRTAETGALPVAVDVDLADPTLTVGVETVDLLDASRTTLLVPHGPLVRADGTDHPPFTSVDLTATDPGGAYAVVAGTPSGRQVRVDHLEGALRFGQALPGAGTLHLGVHVGVWEVDVVRFVGTLRLDVTTDADATSSTVARQIATAVDALGPPFERLVPTAWGPAERIDLGDTAALRRRLSYEFAFEQHQPHIGTGGGIIRTVAVTSTRDAPAPGDRVSEEFTVPVAP